MDDYSFHSTMASSLCVGWIADAPAFDAERAGKLLARYRELRELFTGAWYPLLPYSRRPTDWMASQYHRPDLGKGVILMFRHAESPERTVNVALRGLNADTTYEIARDDAAETMRLIGADLMQRFELTLESRNPSGLIVYQKATRR